MERREMLFKSARACMFPGALVGGIAGALAASAGRQSDLLMYIVVLGVLGVFLGTLIGLIIADHRDPP